MKICDACKDIEPDQYMGPDSVVRHYSICVQMTSDSGNAPPIIEDYRYMCSSCGKKLGELLGQLLDEFFSGNA
jgi:hypothetical protein